MISLWTISFVAGCGADHWPSDRERFDLTDTALVTETGVYYAGGPVLEGSHTCPALSCLGEGCPTITDRGGYADWAEEAAECVRLSASGSGVLEGACLYFAEPGDAVLELFPVGCSGAWASTFKSDTSTLEVRGVDTVSGRFGAHLESYAEEYWRLMGVQGASWPQGWKLSDHELAYIVADATFGVDVALVDTETDEVIAWNNEDGTISASLSNGDSVSVERSGEAQVTLQLEDNTLVTVDLEVAGTTWEVGQLQGVALEELQSLELVAVLQDRQTGATGLEPIGARAIARDAFDEVVFGPPVDWFLDAGALAMAPIAEDAEEPFRDYAFILDLCTPPSESVGEQTATLRVVLDELSAALDVVWDGYYADQATLDADLAAGIDPDEDWWWDETCPNYREPPEDEDEDEDEDEEGPGGVCGCAMAPWTSGVMVLFAGFGGWRRRDMGVLIGAEDRARPS